MFQLLKQKVQKQLAVLVASGPLFRVEPDRDLIWETYLSAIPEQFRQDNTCNCCKSFLRQFGGIVGLKDNKIVSLWDIDHDDPEYSPAVAAIRRYIHTLPITGPYLNDFKKCGTDRNPDKARGIIWEHFSIELPTANVKTKDSIGPFASSARADAEVLLRSINEITPDAVQTVRDLIGQNSLYRGAEFLGVVNSFRVTQEAGLKVPVRLRMNFSWDAASKIGGAACRIRNTSIGTLLVNLSEGMDLDGAVRAFESVVAPTNYKRPTALVTPAMVEKARLRLEELGLTGSLYRRLLTERDLTAENALHVHRPTKIKGGDVFAEIAQSVVVNPKSLTKIEEISIDDFLTNVLPTAKSVRVLVENSHLSNFVSLVGPKSPTDPTMFKWNNNFSWSYAGEVADSIKERVKAAGGNVVGFLRVSLSWNNTDDLDLHIIEPGGYEIEFLNKRLQSPSGGVLDLDANGGDGMRNDPAENVIWVNPPTIGGTFKVVVNQYSVRSTSNSGFEVEIECDGQIYNFANERNGANEANHYVAEFGYTKKNGFSIKAEEKVGKYPSRDKWGIKTGTFQQVKAITLSPNHWETNVGNKHVFFLLDGCKSDEKVRGFYNEFLKQELDGDRKVFEILGSKVEVEVPEGELSGVGFNDTTRNHLICEVEGSFRRTLKIKF